MGFEFFVARRYLTSKRRQAFISIVSIMSIIGVALGVGALVVVMGVYNGFSADIRSKILGANAHILVQGTTFNVFDLDENEEGGYKTVLEKLEKFSEIKAATPYVYTEVLLSTPMGATGLIIRGIEPSDASKALPMLQDLEEGNIDDIIREQKVQGIVIGKELALRFGLSVGDRINLMSPTGEKTSAGFVPKIISYRVAGIFNAGLNDYDNRLAFISLNSARELVGIPKGRISGIELFLDNPFAAETLVKDIQKDLGSYFIVRGWTEFNSGLFAALKLERIGMFIVLSMIILIGSFSIITSLVMLVMEKTKDIAIMMSMGATAKSIRKIFILQGTIIGILGTLIGYAGGLTLAFLLQKYKFIELPPGVYTIDHLPILITFADTAIIGIVSTLTCFLATIYPARQAAKLVPVVALRYE